LAVERLFCILKAFLEMNDIQKLLLETKEEYENLLSQLSNPELISNFEKFEELSKKKKKLEEIIEKGEEIKRKKRRRDQKK